MGIQTQLDTYPSLEAPSWRHRHLLDMDDFVREEVEVVFNTADAMREVLRRDIKRVPTLRGKSIVLLFYEPSTRTRVSFEMAAKNLSADAINLTSTTSSVTKGESLVDTIRTIRALGADAVVIRHPQSGAPYLATHHLDASVINAGDGCHAHPTQALLDLYTVQHQLGKLDGLKITIIGDIVHSRVARSDIQGFGLMGADVVLCGPPTLMPPGWEQNPPRGVTIDTNVNHAVKDADVVMALRLQKERQQEGLLPGTEEYAQLYQLTEHRLSLAKPEALVMHPGPVNEGVEITPEVAQGTQSLIEEQVTNGLAVRMALLYLIVGGKN